MSLPWEPRYGFTDTNTTDNESLAAALESVRRRICVYGGSRHCDCKYGAKPREGQLHAFGSYEPSEKNGCPELRELINRLLHRPDTFNARSV